MKVQVLECPSCGAKIDYIEENRRTPAFCTYCGSRLLIDDGTNRIEVKKEIHINKTISNTNRSIDETRIKEKEIENKMHRRKVWKPIIIVLIFIGFYAGFMGFLGYMAKEEQKELELQVKMPSSARHYRGQDYEIVIVELKGMGFTNIEVSAIPDVWYKKEGTISRISINGNDSFKDGDRIYKDSLVVITYYSKELN